MLFLLLRKLTGSPWVGLAGSLLAAVSGLEVAYSRLTFPHQMAAFALIWIGLSIGLGMLGGPDGSMIAWAAHVGGFLGGFVILKLMKL